MRYLLDVNALVALGFLQHESHASVAEWLKRLISRGPAQLATCSITELRFVRVLSQVQPYGFNIEQARETLLRLKAAQKIDFAFIPDDHDISRLPTWVKAAQRTTDGHLSQLARAKDLALATLDRNIPGAFLIPSR